MELLAILITDVFPRLMNSEVREILFSLWFFSLCVPVHGGLVYWTSMSPNLSSSIAVFTKPEKWLGDMLDLELGKTNFVFTKPEKWLGEMLDMELGKTNFILFEINAPQVR